MLDQFPSQLFEGTDAQPNRAQNTQFYNAVVLKVAMGKFPAGTRFDSVCIDYDQGTIELYGEDTPEGFVNQLGCFELLLTIGDELELP